MGRGGGRWGEIRGRHVNIPSTVGASTERSPQGPSVAPERGAEGVLETSVFSIRLGASAGESAPAVALGLVGTLSAFIKGNGTRNGAVTATPRRFHPFWNLK